MAKTPRRKDVKMQRTLIALPEDLYRELRHFCVDKGTTQGAVVAEALRRYLAEERRGGTRRHSPQEKE
jgi:metal-responsive CopG/Arc/MetJ family transcriptional regulator